MKTLKPIKWVKKDDWTWRSRYAVIRKYIDDPAFYPVVIGCKVALSFSTLKPAKKWCQNQLQEYHNKIQNEIKEIESEVGVEDIR